MRCIRTLVPAVVPNSARLSSSQSTRDETRRGGDERVTPRKGDLDRLEDADVEIGAAVSAKRLRLKRKPRVEVSTHAESEIDPELRPRDGENRGRGRLTH